MAIHWIEFVNWELTVRLAGTSGLIRMGKFAEQGLVVLLPPDSSNHKAARPSGTLAAIP